jgi:methyl-accepting chemotaxis protein
MRLIRTDARRMPKELTMLAKLSIRAKLVAVVSLLLVSLSAMGVFGLLQMRSQNGYLIAIQTSWLSSIQTLGDLREAARLSTQVASNVTEVNRGAGETGSASTQVLSSAQSLSKESGQLRLEVDKFLTAMRAA